MHVVGTGVTADGERRRTDYNRSPTHQLCTCATDEEAGDFSPGGYRYGYINELGFEFCKELVEQAEILDDDCLEHYERDSYALSYGYPPGPPGSELPLCDEDVAMGCQP